MSARPAVPTRAITTGEYHAQVAVAMSEAQLLAQVRALAKTLSWACYHTHRSDRSEAGWPDLVLARGRRVIFRELKRERGVLTQPQREWLGLLAAGGCDSAVWRPADLLDGSIAAELGRDA